MKNRYFVFGDSLYKLELESNVTPISKIERPLLLQSYSDENDSVVVFSYTSGDCVNLVTINKSNERVEERKICFGSQYSYSDNVTISPEGRIYFSIADSMSPPSFLVIKVFVMENIRSDPNLLYIYTGDSLSLLCRQTAFKYHNNFIYGAGYTQFLEHYSTFFTVFNIQTRTLQSYIRKNDNFSTSSGEFGRRFEYFSRESGNGWNRIRKYVLDPTSVDDLNQSRYEYVLYQNYPNPFNPVTKIRFSIKETNPVKIKLYDIVGREVAVIMNEVKDAGEYEIELNAGKLGISSGVYFYQMKAGDYTSIKKMVYLK